MLAGVDPNTTPVGQWCDAAWAAYVGYVLDASAAGGQPVTEAIDETWAQMAGPPQSAPSATAGPSKALRAPVATPAPGQTIRDVPIDPETGLPRRPTAADRQAWALASAANSDLSGLMGNDPQSGAADRVGG